MMFYVLDALEIIMGPYSTFEEAHNDMMLHIDELYLEDTYPCPYVDFIDEEDEDSYDRW